MKTKTMTMEKDDLVHQMFTLKRKIECPGDEDPYKLIDELWEVEQKLKKINNNGESN